MIDAKSFWHVTLDLRFLQVCRGCRKYCGRCRKLQSGAMAKTAVKERKQKMVQQPTPPTQGESEEESDVDFELDGEPEKDDVEQELERLVFGDSAGFREGLREVALGEAESDGEDEDAATGFEGLDDADVGQARLTRQGMM